MFDYRLNFVPQPEPESTGRFSRLLLGLVLLAIPVAGIPQADLPSDGISVSFADDGGVISAADRDLIREITKRSAREVRALLPELHQRLAVRVSLLDQDLSSVGGVTGRADDPTTVVVYVSTSFGDGVRAAAETGLAPVLYHEFHHLVRGWTIAGNQFGPGIAIAAVNEGLANVFAEIHTDTAFPGNAYPDHVEDWVEEILRLPVNASYSHWIVRHPDGRDAVGYKVGSYLVRQAMAASGLSIIELSARSVEDILQLAGTDLSR